MSSTFYLNEFAGLYGIRDKLTMIKDTMIANAGDQIENSSSDGMIDLTLDLFNIKLRPETLYHLFSQIEKTVQAMDRKRSMATVFLNYPFQSNLSCLLQLQKIIQQYTEILKEYYGVVAVYLPTLVSIASIQKASHPPARIIYALQNEIIDNIPFKGSAGFHIIYEMDLLAIFNQKKDGFKKETSIQGKEMTLEEMLHKSYPILGSTPVPFGQKDFIQYYTPAGELDRIQALNYDWEDMVMDIATKRY